MYEKTVCKGDLNECVYRHKTTGLFISFNNNDCHYATCRIFESYSYYIFAHADGDMYRNSGDYNRVPIKSIEKTIERKKKLKKLNRNG